MGDHITKTSSASFHYLYNIRRITKTVQKHWYMPLFLGPVHTFENATLSLRIRPPSTRIRWKQSMQTELFEYRTPEWNFLETLFSRVRVDRRKRNFSKTLRTHYQFQSTSRNIRNLFKMADERFPFLSFILALVSNLTACLILEAGYSRRRQNIIRLL